MEIKKLWPSHVDEEKRFKVGKRYSLLGNSRDILEVTFVKFVPTGSIRLCFVDKDGKERGLLITEETVKYGMTVVVHDEHDTFLVEIGSTIAGIAVIIGGFETKEEAEQYRSKNLEIGMKIAELNKEQADEECSVNVWSRKELDELLFTHFKQDTQLDALYIEKTDDLKRCLKQPIRSS